MTLSDETIAVTEEVLRIDKRRVATGTVRVRTETETVQELASIMLERQDVEVTRIILNQPVQQAPQIRTEGDVTIIPVVEEVLVVEKRLVLREELHVRKSVSRERYEEPVTLRKQHAVVDYDDQRQIPSAKEPLP